MNAAAQPADAGGYIFACDRCKCEQHTRIPRLPAGWRLIEAAPHCDDCVRFHNFSRLPALAEDIRTQDSSSAINDEPPALLPQPCVGAAALEPAPHERQWQITVNFITDKGVVESSSIVHAANPLAAIDELVIQWSRIDEMFALTVTPAPLPARTAGVN